MKHFLIYIFFIALTQGCKPKELSGAALENKLKQTMKEYLHNTLEPGVGITVNDVIYYPDKAKKLYLCEFNVSTNYGNKDTTGTMAATISNDFNEVVRTR